MNTVAKILIVVNLVLAGAFLASAGNFLGQMDHWKNKYEVDDRGSPGSDRSETRS